MKRPCTNNMQCESVWITWRHHAVILHDDIMVWKEVEQTVECRWIIITPMWCHVITNTSTITFDRYFIDTRKPRSWCSPKRRIGEVLPHNGDVIMGSIESQITSPTIVYLGVYSGADQRKHQSSASLAFVRGIHRGPVNSTHKGPVTRKMFPFDDVIM